ncbi:Putative sigma-Y antisigma factor component [Bacillus subtilis QB928]|nr:Putative sigma-Y antisigma factor component [Bacillus subtilis QB928]
MRGETRMTQTEIIITVAACLIVLAQGIFLFIDAKKRNHMAWVWGIVGLIQAPMPLICYYFFVIRPDRKKRGIKQ